MVEERNLTTTDDTPELELDTPTAAEPTKEELHQRMEQTRESISQTVAEIKDTVTNKYEKISDDISRTLDWREHVNRNPLAFNLGALVLGFAAGFLLMGGSLREHHEESRHLLATGEGGETPEAGDETHIKKVRKPRKAKQGPGFLEKVKESETFHHLQDEVVKMGDRFLDEIITVGNEVLLPAVVAKLREAVDELIPAEKTPPARLDAARAEPRQETSTDKADDATSTGTSETLSQSKTNTL